MALRAARGSWLAGGAAGAARLSAAARHTSHRSLRRSATSSASGTSRQAQSWASRFEAANTEHPLLVRGGVGVALYAISDTVAQYIQARSAVTGGDAQPFSLDLVRTGQVCSWRALVFTPIFYTFYLVLDVAVSPLVGTRMVVTKLFVDLIMMGPSITVSFFVWLQMCETGDYSASLAATKEKLWPALVLGWIYWLPMHTLTYSVVPLRYRLFWVNFCSVWWGAGLSSLNALDAAADDTVSASIEATATATAAIGTY